MKQKKKQNKGAADNVPHTAHLIQSNQPNQMKLIYGTRPLPNKIQSRNE